jgi:hypothetical protein
MDMVIMMATPGFGRNCDGHGFGRNCDGLGFGRNCDGHDDHDGHTVIMMVIMMATFQDAHL